MKYYFGLLIVVAVSILSLLEYNTNIHIDRTDVLPRYIQILIPGLSFSLFLVVILYKQMTILESSLVFCLFIVGYFGMGLLGLLAIPLAGALGGMYIGLMLKYIFNYKTNQTKFILFGFFAIVPGFALGFVPFKIENKEGIILSIIVVLWQIIIGYITLEEIKLIVKAKQNKLSNDLLDQDINC